MVQVEIGSSSLIPSEHCPGREKFPCRDDAAIKVQVHCDHWYDDGGCHACATEAPNLVILDNDDGVYSKIGE